MALMGVWANQSAQKGLEEKILLAGFDKKVRELSLETLMRASLGLAPSVLRRGAEEE